MNDDTTSKDKALQDIGNLFRKHPGILLTLFFSGLAIVGSIVVIACQLGYGYRDKFAQIEKDNAHLMESIKSEDLINTLNKLSGDINALSSQTMERLDKEGKLLNYKDELLKLKEEFNARELTLQKDLQSTKLKLEERDNQLEERTKLIAELQSIINTLKPENEEFDIARSESRSVMFDRVTITLKSVLENVAYISVNGKNDFIPKGEYKIFTVGSFDYKIQLKDIGKDKYALSRYTRSNEAVSAG